MNRLLCGAAFASGMLALAWVGYGYVGAHPLALTMTALITAFYLMGALELRRFHQTTQALAQALTAIPAPLNQLSDWLVTLPDSLQNPVRLRVEGERVALPGPAMTPFLVGLLVLLGMLGTFLGMVVTLHGAVQALEGSADLTAIRAALTAPVQGLGLAFGTSVAGVAASAMLGLMSALCRRERLHAAQRLDSRIATVLRVFSRAHQRDESVRALQAQAQWMPAVVEQLQQAMAQMAQQGQQLNERLLANQAHFHQHTQSAYADLASSVDRTLRHSLSDSARVAAATLQPAVEAAMAGITRETSALHTRVADTVQQQLDGLAARFGTTVTQLMGGWEQRSADTLAAMDRAQAAWQDGLVAQDAQRWAAWRQAMEDLAAGLHRQWQQAGEQAEAQTRATMAEVQRLIHAASEAPRVAAEVTAQLREQLSSSLANDNAMLEERARIMATLSGLLDAVQHASTEQRGAIDALLTHAAAVLEQAGTRFTDRVALESDKMTAVSAQITGSAVEVSSLGEAFGHAVTLFAESNDQLMQQLHRIEGALSQTLTRSDDQLAYYVAQAREVIDLSLLSQRQIVEDLQRVAGRPAAWAEELA